MIKSKLTNYILFTFFYLLIGLYAFGQKLPNKQETSVRAPQNIKIDGKLMEWNNQFQAYNHATEIFYTIANNSENLYLAIKATNPDIINKIMLGGITLTISSEKNTNSNGVIITYPLFDNKNLTFMKRANIFPKSKDTIEHKRLIDSVVNSLNIRLTERIKFLGIKGIKSIEDTVISVYNEQGIKAFSHIDNMGSYTCELMLPLRYLNLPKDKDMPISYNIKLNGAQTSNSHIQMDHSGRFLLVSGGGSHYAIPALPEMMSMAYATDFSGEYTLAKKP